MATTQTRQVGAVASAVILVIILFLAFLFGFVAISRKHNASAGSPRPGDSLLWSEILQRLPSEEVYEEGYCFNGTVFRAIITAYNITNLMTSDDGGYVVITSGGLYNSSLCFTLTNQAGQGYRFNASVWGTAEVVQSSSVNIGKRVNELNSRELHFGVPNNNSNVS